MRHRDNDDLLRADPVDQTKRKVRQEISTRSVDILRPTRRGLTHTFHAGVDFCHKSGYSTGTLLGVPLHCGFDFGSGCRVKSNLDVVHPYAS